MSRQSVAGGKRHVCRQSLESPAAVAPSITRARACARGSTRSSTGRGRSAHLCPPIAQVPCTDSLKFVRGDGGSRGAEGQEPAFPAFGTRRERTMVALRRPAELPEPEDDGLPFREIKSHTRDKLHYWGNYLWAASNATSKAFPGTRVCADLFAGHGLCYDKKADRYVWGSALLALQMPSPFDLYIFNDIQPDATEALAARIR